jgi:hypothetical protein
LRSQNIIEELGRHNYKQVDIAIFAMIATSQRAKEYRTRFIKYRNNMCKYI